MGGTLAPLAGSTTQSQSPQDAPPSWITDEEWSQGVILTTVAAQTVTSGPSVYLQWDGNSGNARGISPGFHMEQKNSATTVFTLNNGVFSGTNPGTWSGDLPVIPVLSSGTPSVTLGKMSPANISSFAGLVFISSPWCIPQYTCGNSSSISVTKNWQYNQGYITTDIDAMECQGDQCQDFGPTTQTQNPVNGTFYLTQDVTTGDVSLTQVKPGSEGLWISPRVQYDCCTYPVGFSTGNVCTPSWVNGGTSGGSQCNSFMTRYCVDGFSTDFSTCLGYLNNLFPATSDRDTLVDQTVTEYLQSKNYQYDKTDPFFSKVIPTICPLASRGTCDPALDNFCKVGNNGQPFTREDLENDPILQQLCGCHLDTTVPDNVPYTGLIPQECDPICVYSGTIPRKDPCTQTVCIFDDVTVENIDSTGDTNITNYCPASANGGSSCFMSNLFIEKINSYGNINMKNYCGTCFLLEPGQDPRTATQIPCDSSPPGPAPPDGNGLVSSFVAYSRTTMGKVTLGIILAISLAINILGALYLRKIGYTDWWVIMTLGILIHAVIMFTGYYYVTRAR